MNETSNQNLESTIALKLELEDIGCEELAGQYRGFKFYWCVRTGCARLHGENKVQTGIRTQKDLLLWALAKG